MTVSKRKLKMTAPVLFCISMLISTAQAFAAGECGTIEEPKKRMECIEAKIDALTNQVKTVSTKVDNVPDIIQSELKGVKIEWRDHPGVCLNFHDWAPGNNVTYSVLGCDNGNYVFNIKK